MTTTAVPPARAVAPPSLSTSTRRTGAAWCAGLLLAGVVLASPSAARAQESPDPKGEHLVVVTVDDLPIAANRLHPDPAERERITRGMLDVFAKHGIRAVGLVTWQNLQPEDGTRLLQLWLDAGHELGNHSYAHLDYSRTASAAYLADVERGRSELAAFLAPRGRNVRWFRFPFLREGETPEKLQAARDWLAATGQRNLPVTLDNQDWSFEEPWVLARRAGDRARMARLAEDYQRSLQLEVLAQTVAGDELFEGRPTAQVLLLHANEVGAAQWDALFTWMKGRGFRFATVDEVLADPAYAEPHRFVGAYGGSLWGRLANQRGQVRAEKAVRTLLEAQAAAWNRGDLEAFVTAYAPDIVFATPGGVVHGRDAVLARYRARYATPEAMGRLALEPLDVRTIWGPEVTMLGDAEPGRVHAVSVLARWTLESADPPSAGSAGAVPGSEGGATAAGSQPAAAGRRTGTTLLVFRRVPGGGWQIVHDASF